MRRNGLAWVLPAMAGGAGAASYGIVFGNEPWLAFGLGLAFLSALLLPVFVARARRKRKLAGVGKFLAEWEYGLDEARLIAGARRNETLRQKGLHSELPPRRKLVQSTCVW